MNNNKLKIILLVACLILIQSNFVFSVEDKEIMLSAEKLVTAWGKAFEKEIHLVNQYKSLGSSQK